MVGVPLPLDFPPYDLWRHESRVASEVDLSPVVVPGIAPDLHHGGSVHAGGKELQNEL